MNKVDELRNIARRNGVLWDVEMQATRLMEEGLGDIDSYVIACRQQDLF